jgi:hypothetical protein
MGTTSHSGGGCEPRSQAAGVIALLGEALLPLRRTRSASVDYNCISALWLLMPTFSIKLCQKVLHAFDLCPHLTSHS